MQQPTMQQGQCSGMNTMYIAVPVNPATMLAEAEALERESAQLKIRAQLIAEAEALEQGSAQLKARALQLEKRECSTLQLERRECPQFQITEDEMASFGSECTQSTQVTDEDAISPQAAWQSRSGSPVPCRFSQHTEQEHPQNEIYQAGVNAISQVFDPNAAHHYSQVMAPPMTNGQNSGAPIACYMTHCVVPTSMEPQCNGQVLTTMVPVHEGCQWAPAYQVADSSQDTRTALMMRNLPNDYTRDMVLTLLDSKGFQGYYDFFYLPVDFQRGSGLGYAFVNFVSHGYAEHARQVFQSFKDWKIPSQKVLEVSWSGFSQGLEANIERYQNSSVLHPSVPEEFKPLLFVNGLRVAFPSPTKAIKHPRLKIPYNAVQQSESLAVVAGGGILTPWERIMKTISVVNSHDMEKIFAHARDTLSSDLTFVVPGVTEQLRNVSQVCTFHRQLHSAIPDICLNLQQINLDKLSETMAWRVTCTGTQVKSFIPTLPIGARAIFLLEVKVTQGKHGKPVHITWTFSADSKAALENSVEEKELSPEELLHRRGECQPCAYFAFRADGCRAGDDCEFCHLCTKSQAKSKKKARGELLRAAEAAGAVAAPGC